MTQFLNIVAFTADEVDGCRFAVTLPNGNGRGRLKHCFDNVKQWEVEEDRERKRFMENMAASYGDHRLMVITPFSSKTAILQQLL